MILIVEDNPSVAEVFAEALAKAGYESEIANTGREALILLASKPYQLVLMDLSLPDMNGAEVTRRAEEAGSEVPVIAVTGALPLMDMGKLDAAGFVATIEKPCRISAMLELIQKLRRAPAA